VPAAPVRASPRQRLRGLSQASLSLRSSPHVRLPVTHDAHFVLIRTSSASLHIDADNCICSQTVLCPANHAYQRQVASVLSTSPPDCLATCQLSVVRTTAVLLYVCCCRRPRKAAAEQKATTASQVRIAPPFSSRIMKQPLSEVKVRHRPDCRTQGSCQILALLHARC